MITASTLIPIQQDQFSQRVSGLYAKRQLFPAFSSQLVLQLIDPARDLYQPRTLPVSLQPSRYLYYPLCQPPACSAVHGAVFYGMSRL